TFTGMRCRPVSGAVSLRRWGSSLFCCLCCGCWSGCGCKPLCAVGGARRPAHYLTGDIGMHIHILGIGGTFMAGVAMLAKAAGHHVTGSDAGVYPPMSTQLARAGIDV